MKHLHISLIIILLFFTNVLFSEESIDSLQIELSEISLTDEKKAEVLYELGVAYYAELNYPLALDYLRKSVIKYQKLSDSTKKGIALVKIGEVYSEINDYEKAIKNYLEALNIFENSDHKKSFFEISLNIGSLYLNLENYNQALVNLYKAKTFFELDTIHFKKELKNTYTAIGVSHGYTENIDSALIYFNKSIPLIPADDYETKGGLFNNIGAIHSKKKEFNNALEYYNNAHDWFVKCDSKKGIGVSISNLAYIEYLKENYKEAETLYLKALLYFEELSSAEYTDQCYFYLNSVYEKLGNTNKALEYLHKYIENRETLMNSNIIREIADLEMKYKIQKIEKKNELEIKLIEKEKELSLYKWYILSGILIIILIILGFLFYRRITQKRIVEIRLKNIRKEKNFMKSELENFALHMAHRNEFLEDVKLTLKSLTKNASEANQQKVKELNLNISQLLQNNKGMQLIKNKIEALNTNFFFSLSQKHPNLTEKDKRLCALLKLNLSSKEISSINNISERSVVTARYRLRKKLGLNSDENLNSYFKNMSK